MPNFFLVHPAPVNLPSRVAPNTGQNLEGIQSRQTKITQLDIDAYLAVKSGADVSKDPRFQSAKGRKALKRLPKFKRLSQEDWNKIAVGLSFNYPHFITAPQNFRLAMILWQALEPAEARRWSEWDLAMLFGSVSLSGAQNGLRIAKHHNPDIQLNLSNHWFESHGFRPTTPAQARQAEASIFARRINRQLNNIEASLNYIVEQRANQSPAVRRQFAIPVLGARARGNGIRRWTAADTTRIVTLTAPPNVRLFI